MADNDDLRQKNAERLKKHAEHMRLVRAQKTLDKMNAKIQMLEQQMMRNEVELVPRARHSRYPVRSRSQHSSLGGSEP